MQITEVELYDADNLTPSNFKIVVYGVNPAGIRDILPSIMNRRNWQGIFSIHSYAARLVQPEELRPDLEYRPVVPLSVQRQIYRDKHGKSYQEGIDYEKV